MAGEGLGEFIRERRKALGLSQRALAREAGVSASYMSQIEKGTRTWPKKYIPGIARALEVPEARLALAAGMIAEEYDDTVISDLNEQFSNASEELRSGILLLMISIDDWIEENKDRPHKGPRTPQLFLSRPRRRLIRRDLESQGYKVEMTIREDGFPEWRMGLPGNDGAVRLTYEPPAARRVRV